MPKPLTLVQARPIIRKLLEPSRFKLLQNEVLCAVYIGDSPSAGASGASWEDVVEALVKSKYQPQP